MPTGSPAGPGAARRAFRDGLGSGVLQRFMGVLNPYTARLIQDAGFEGVYVSGSVLAAERGLPDIGLTTATEVAARGADIVENTSLPVLIDADTGFGEPMNVARTIGALEHSGVAGCHLEDQVNPKRCGHLDGKQVVSTEDMVRRVRAAVASRVDPDFVICARTDARAIEGFDAAVERARAYVAAGADLVFPEALADLSEFEAFAKAVDAPILANMTEFGRSELFTATQLHDAGVSVVIYPVTLQRIAMGAIERALTTILADGTQQALVPDMQTRARLYEVLDYEGYNRFDSSVFDFAVPDAHASISSSTSSTTSPANEDEGNSHV